MKRCIAQTTLIVIIVLFGAVLSHNLKYINGGGVRPSTIESGISKVSQMWRSLYNQIS